MKEFFNFPSSKISWFRCGGEIKVFCIVENQKELQDVVEKYVKSGEVKNFCVVGAGSNVLFRDGLFDGLVVKLAGDFASLNVVADDENKIIAGSCVLSKQVASFAVENNLVGAEFLDTIPGSVGGIVKMNAGCFGSEIKDIFYSADILINGEVKTLMKNDVVFEYRKTSIPDDAVILNACFELKKGQESEIEESKAKIAKMREHRKEKQIVGATCGSTFANHFDKDGSVINAWKLIDEVGLRGFEIGGAKFSEKHCNFIINNGNATATDIINLISEAKKRVFEKFGIELRLEIKIV